MPERRELLCLLLAVPKPVGLGEAAEVREGASWAWWNWSGAQAHWSLPAGRLRGTKRVPPRVGVP